MRNVINYFPCRLREEVKKDLNKIYLANTKHKAMDNFKLFKQRWEIINQKGVRSLEKDLEELLSYYDVIDEINITQDKEKLAKMIKTTI